MTWIDENIAEAFLGAVGLWGASVIFLLPLKRKDHFPLRIGLIAVAAVTASEIWLHYFRGWEILEYTGAEMVFLILCYLGVTVICYLCAEVHGFEMCYCGVWIMMTSMLAAGVGQIIRNIYEWETGREGFLLKVLFIVVIYVLIGMTVARWMPEKQHYNIGPRQMLSAWVLCIMSITLCSFSDFQERNILLSVMLQFYCITILYLQSALFKKSSMRKELEMVQLLWHQQKDQYRISRETIDLINHKCHDLKHQVQAMRAIRDDEEREQYLKEVENSVQIYNAIVHTGNEILDTLLTEKSLLCEKNGIHINCVADGTLLSFMDPVDLYTLFGNALDNAIEAVRKIGPEEERVVDIMIYERQKFIVIQIVNPVWNEVKFVDGIPLTTKARNGYHGFGMKSMKHTAEKYDGFLSAEVKNRCFYLKVMVPVQKREG